jgi:hypothetical protein
MRLPALPAFFHSHASVLPAAARQGRRLLATSLCVLLAACGGGGGGSSSGTGSTGSSGSNAAAVVVSISASPTSVQTGGQISLTWNAANAGSCTASGAWSGSVATSGTKAVTAGSAGTATYTLTCDSVSNSASVTITAPVPAPTVSITLAPASVATGASSTLTWSSTNTTACTASGAWSGSRATSGALTVSQGSAGTYPYTIVCNNSANATATASTALTVTTASAVNNSAVINVDNGPAGGKGSINVPFVSVTVCRPGTTTCQTIDHVMVDTGSYGLRLIASTLNSALALPALTAPSGAAAAECGQFVSGYTWGAVRAADIQIAGETASSVPVQVIGDAGSVYGSVPKACSSIGSNLGNVRSLGANGILGVGLFKQDCGSGCANSSANGFYFACPAGGCSASAMPLSTQVSNPVAYFATDNNGVLIVMPSVPTGGVTGLTGQLIFGINTQSNNAVGTETVYAASSKATFTTVYKNQTATDSFIDSGSNGYFFNDSSLPACTLSTDFYCPTTPLTLSAVNKAASGTTSGTVPFTIEDVDSLGSNITAASIGGISGAGSFTANGFDWGLPFFFGRRVFVALENTTTATGTGPYWAY